MNAPTEEGVLWRFEVTHTADGDIHDEFDGEYWSWRIYDGPSDIDYVLFGAIASDPTDVLAGIVAEHNGHHPGTMSDDKVEGHVADIYFNSAAVINRACTLCQEAARRGLFGRFDDVDDKGWPPPHRRR